MAGRNGEPMAATPQRQYGKAAKSIWQETFFLFGGFCFPGLLFLDIQAGPDPVDLMKGGS